MRVKRHFVSEGKSAYDGIEWEKRLVELKRPDGTVVFRQEDVEVPSTWSETATTILATKYFRGTLGTPERETSLRQVIHRIVNSIRLQFRVSGYGDEEAADALSVELRYMLAHQMMAFNSPVWFNVGVEGVPQQVSACFILDVEDDMESILNWYREEGLIFKGGSGSGINLSKLRGSNEQLKGGGTASGPVSFMRGADASAGTIKSGGKTRRAAKMVVLNADHPDIEEFIWCKAREEEKARALASAGFDMSLDGRDVHSIQYQNANNSVRVTDKFMHNVVNDGLVELRNRTGGTAGVVSARHIWRQIAEAAWACADPGLQFDSAANMWNTTPVSGRIDASNPCSEHMRLANSSCNLASLNLLKFIRQDGTFDAESFTHAARVTFIAQDVLIDLADFPTEKITHTTLSFRDLGLGYANLGAALMMQGLGYGTDEGRQWAAAITALLTGTAARTSTELANAVGTFPEYSPNKAGAINVMEMHHDALLELLSKPLSSHTRAISSIAMHQWELAIDNVTTSGMRNAELTVLAPTGTIGLLMDCETTGIEPYFDLSTTKTLVGGGEITSTSRVVERALSIVGGDVDVNTHPVFKTAAGVNALTPEEHVRMMGAVQPFISGAISKTCNMPNSSTVEDVEALHLLAWELGLKAIAIYRDGCKVAQPLAGSQAPAGESDVAAAPVPYRRRLPRQRRAYTRSFTVGELEGYVTTGEFEDGSLGEVFLRVAKQGSTLGGVLDAFAIAVSLGLQYGVPLESFIEKFVGQKFEPHGFTDDPDVRMTQSIVDYIFRRLAIDYLEFEDRVDAGVLTTDERKVVVTEQLDIGGESHSGDRPICTECGNLMQAAGACYVCASCGTTSGCS